MPPGQPSPGVSLAAPDIHAVLVDILSEVVALCDREGIPYCLIGGGCLGIARHGGGFVPWDDDLDLAVWATDMPRFVAAMAKLPGHLAVRRKSAGVNPAFMVTDTRTRTLDSGFEEAPGIFVDIVPMMVWRSPRWKRLDVALDRIRRFDWNPGSSPPRNAAKRVLRLARVPAAAGWLADRIAVPLFLRQDQKGRSTGRGTITAAFRRTWVGAYDYGTVFPLARADFCGVAVSVPRDLHRFLERRYGPDYLAPPPEDGRWRHFSGVVRVAGG